MLFGSKVIHRRIGVEAQIAVQPAPEAGGRKPRPERASAPQEEKRYG
jgi:hypothetical protein